jgi:HEAT repeat protein
MTRDVPKTIRRFLLIGGLGMAVAGCAHDWDEITSRDFKFKDMFVSPDPMAVLRDNPDGDARAKAIAKLKEPKKHGGSDAQETEAIELLTRQATTVPEPLCRLEAIRALGRFDDPRTTAPLIQSYYNAGNEKNFTPEISNQIRTCAVDGLGHKTQPEAMALLVQVATPAKAPNPVQPAGFTGGSGSDSLGTRDVRLAAVRALGMTHDRQAIPVLLLHLSDKDVAVRDAAHASLKAITGLKEVEPDAQSWQTAMGTKK